jgi:hypothetical protein
MARTATPTSADCALQEWLGGPAAPVIERGRDYGYTGVTTVGVSIGHKCDEAAEFELLVGFWRRIWYKSRQGVVDGWMLGVIQGR